MFILFVACSTFGVVCLILQVRHWSEVGTSCEAYVGVLDTYIEGKYNEWLVSMQNDDEHKEDEEDKGKDGSSNLVAGLENHLMVRQQRTEEEMFHAASEGLTQYQQKETVKRNKHSGRLENNFDHNLMRLFMVKL